LVFDRGPGPNSIRMKGGGGRGKKGPPSLLKKKRTPRDLNTLKKGLPKLQKRKVGPCAQEKQCRRKGVLLSDGSKRFQRPPKRRGGGNAKGHIRRRIYLYYRNVDRSW